MNFLPRHRKLRGRFAVETYFLAPRLPGDMASVDPFIVLIVGALLALILFFYLMLRRTLLGFKEGMDDGRR